MAIRATFSTTAGGAVTSPKRKKAFRGATVTRPAVATAAKPKSRMGKMASAALKKVKY